MLIAAVTCLCVAVLVGAAGLWSILGRSVPGAAAGAADPVRRVLRSVAPTQLAAAAMLAAAAVVAFVGPAPAATIVLIMAALGAVATIGAGCYQSARAVSASTAGAGAVDAADCAGSCAACTLSCR